MLQIALPNPSVMLYMCNHKNTRHRRVPLSVMGASLIELMVGITIGLLVVIGAVGSLVFTQATTTVLADTAHLQQKADAIFSNLGMHLLQAGAVNMEWSNAGVKFSDNYTGINTSSTGLPGQMLSIHGVEESSNFAEALRVSYQDNMRSTDDAATRQNLGVRDCLGNRPAVEFTNIDNEFFRSGTDLMCRGASAAPNEAQAIADGVEDFQVWYGIQSLDASGNPQYLFYSADKVPNWSSIHAVRVCILLRGDSQGNPTPDLSLTGCNGQSISNDGRIRRVYWRTFGIRNALL